MIRYLETRCQRAEKEANQNMIMTQKPENKFYEKLIMEEQSQNEIQEMIRDLQGCLKKKDEELWSAKSEYEKIVLKNEALKSRI